MKAQVTRFRAVESKRDLRPSDGRIAVTDFGLEVERRPESRDTWGGRVDEPKNPESWPDRQVARVYLSRSARLRLAADLIADVLPELASAVRDLA